MHVSIRSAYLLATLILQHKNQLNNVTHAVLVDKVKITITKILILNTHGLF